ncbi:hypothetical protein [Hymenobacter profundi]|uniref:S9 family peptidase n=1 Tax=Hymenobacter profundi TaxID=1982110 RepID=A0ABS6X282_9BACT|nr:hypothetical protein [Hymenobacter profundi]MBW3129784.1 hypothetical protein [Hymenobacter profundi]
MRLTFLSFSILLGSTLLAPKVVQAQKTKSVSFAYLPEQSYDRYNQRVSQKTLSQSDGGFLILAHKSVSGYAVERYDGELKRVWSTDLPLTAEESIEGFAQSNQQATVVIYRKTSAAQQLTAYTFDLKTGQKSAGKKLIEAGLRDRRPGVTFSPDGTHTIAWRYLTREQQIKAILANVYDAQLSQVKERTYDFHDQGAFFSTTVSLGNDGTQYVTLLSDGMKKLSVRHYLNTSTEVKVMSVALGGVFGGQEVMVFDTKFSLQPDNTLYAAAICTERKTGLYHSLKAVRFDFTDEGDMKFAPEVKFSPDYLAEVNKATQGTSKRLEDIYLAQLLVNEDKQLVIIAQKQYEEGGENSPIHSRELHLFGYNEFLAPRWHTIINKNQVAPPAEAFSSIGFRAAIFGPDLQLLTEETIKGKSDLYVRHVDMTTGVVQEPKGLGLKVANDQNLAYVKDFTTWADAKTIIGVSRPSKKSAALMLNKIVVK